jgi:hypothetical protein
MYRIEQERAESRAGLRKTKTARSATVEDTGVRKIEEQTRSFPSEKKG